MLIPRSLLFFPVVVPWRSKQQISPRVRRTSETREMLRQHQDHEERSRFAILRRESQVPGRGDGSGWRRGIPRFTARSRELSSLSSYRFAVPAGRTN